VTAGAPAPDVRHGPSGTDTFMRRAGRTVVGTLYGALRALKLYPVENAAVQKALADLVAAADVVLARDHELVVRASGEVIFVNDVRLRLELDSYGAFNHVLSLWRACGVGTLRVQGAAEARAWLALLNALQRPSSAPPEERLEEIRERLHLAGVRPFELTPPVDEVEDEYEEEAKATSKRLYAQSVAVAKEVLQSARIGRPPSLRRMKRAVQGIVEQILSDETPLVGLTTLRDFDEYTFTHSVNVGIFSVAIGKRLGLSKVQLYDLGLAAFLHDIGKTRLPVELINKTSDLSSEEWALIRAHPWLGMLVMFGMLGTTQELPLRAMRVAYEHHLRVDRSGYPRPIRPRDMGLFSRIVAVADGFDAATSRRSYQSTPYAPSQVLEDMRGKLERGLDQTVVKALINTIGVYPVGSAVVLDSYELAVVHAASTDPEALSRPVVRIVTDRLGNAIFPGQLADLTARDENGTYLRSILNTVDPERYGIRISDYFI
jgi:HD-GYP domain-containing protein (c-di-GMP phosphodiesterase class II)